MLGLVTKKQLLQVLKKLADNNDSENATCITDFYWRCGNENAISNA